MRLLFLLLLLSTSGFAGSDPMMPMTVKERLRILLWTEGLKEQEIQKKEFTKPAVELPEEIERPLRNL